LTTFDLHLESGPRHQKTMVHVLDLLGCVAVGPTTEDALAATPAAIHAFRRFLHRHGERITPDAPFETRIVEHLTAGEWLGNGSPYLIFGPDLALLTDNEIETFLNRAQWLTDDLAEWVTSQTDNHLDAPASGRTAREILHHVLAAQGSFLAAALGSAPGFSRLASAAKRGDIGLAAALHESGRMVTERVHATSATERATARALPSGSYTLRMALRRLLEHDWEHLAELARHPGGPPL